VSGAYRVDLTGNWTIRVRQECRHWSHQRRIQANKPALSGLAVKRWACTASRYLIVTIS
jgi:hypothetical protein